MVDLSAFRNLGGFLFVAWLAILVLLFVPPKDPPGSAPVRRLDFATPVCGMPLSGYFREPVPCIAVPDAGQRDTAFPDQYDPVPLTYEERFSAEAIGVEMDLQGIPRRCVTATAAVHEQGIGD